MIYALDRESRVARSSKVGLTANHKFEIHTDDTCRGYKVPYYRNQ